MLRRLFAPVAASTPLTLLVLAILVSAIVAIAVYGFALTVAGALGLYFVLWWTFLFAVLPLGNQPESDPEQIVPGQDPGAPAAPRLREKALLTTMVAAGVFFLTITVFPLARL